MNKKDREYITQELNKTQTALSKGLDTWEQLIYIIERQHVLKQLQRDL